MGVVDLNDIAGDTICVMFQHGNTLETGTPALQFDLRSLQGIVELPPMVLIWLTQDQEVLGTIHLNRVEQDDPYKLHGWTTSHFARNMYRIRVLRYWNGEKFINPPGMTVPIR